MEQEYTNSNSLLHRIFHDPADRGVPTDFPADILLNANANANANAELVALRQENASLHRSVRLNEGLRQRFENLYDTAPEGYFTIDADDRITEANLTLAQQLGIERPQLIGQHVGSFIAAISHAEFIRHLTQVRETLQPETCVLTMQDAHHQGFEVRLESKPVITAFMMPFVVIQSCVSSISEQNADTQTPSEWEAINVELHSQLQAEIHQREQAEEKLRQLETRMMRVARLNTAGQMTSGLAHEIIQPLTAITSYAQRGINLLCSARERGHCPEQRLDPLEEIFTKVVRQAGRTAKIVRHLRQFITREAAHRESVDLTKVVNNAVSMVLNELHNNDIKFDIQQPENLPACEADPIQIEQVILNLLRNAIEAMADVPADHRRLTVELQAIDDGQLQLLVRDTGPGINKENMDKVSTPFFSTKDEGMGMGLSISRAIIEDHGGRLAFETHDEGATFSFTLACSGRLQSVPNP